MKPGGSSAEEPLDQASVTWSYLAPPMPCRNRSPRTSRAQSVVISARRADLARPRPASSTSRSTAPAGVAVGRKRQRDLQPLRGRRARSRRPLAGTNSRAAPRDRRPSRSRTGLQPVAVGRQVGHRMGRAADAVHPAVLGDRLVVDVAQPRQARPAGAPANQANDSDCAHPALRNLQACPAPTGPPAGAAPGPGTRPGCRVCAASARRPAARTARTSGSGTSGAICSRRAAAERRQTAARSRIRRSS